MLLTAVRDEFASYNECRKLSPKAVKTTENRLIIFSAIWKMNQNH